MKPTSAFTFRQNPSAPTRYILTGHRGLPVEGFPAKYVQGANKGAAYIGFRGTVINKGGHRRFSHTIELDKSKTVTGVNFDPSNPGKTYGDFGADARLVEVGEAKAYINIWFFAGLKDEAESLYGKWVSGELPEIASVDVAPVTGVEAKKIRGLELPD